MDDNIRFRYQHASEVTIDRQMEIADPLSNPDLSDSASMNVSQIIIGRQIENVDRCQILICLTTDRHRLSLAGS